MTNDRKHSKTLNVIIFILMLMIIAMQIYFVIYAGRNDSTAERVVSAIMLLAETAVVSLYMADYQLNRKNGMKAYKDVTGIQNKRAYYEHLRRIEEARDTFEKGIISFDLNNLKYVNDNYGHKKGDEYIGAFAAILIGLDYKDISAYRIGGDEFSIIMDDANDVIVHRILDEIDRQVEKYNTSRNIKISYAYGYEISTTDHYYVVDELVQRADDNMYKNKREYKAAGNKKRVYECI